MEDKVISREIRELIFQLNEMVSEAVEKNKLTVKISTFAISQVGTKDEIYYTECRIYKEVL